MGRSRSRWPAKGYPGSFKNMEEHELLKYALEHGMINVSYVQEQMEMNERRELLEKHPYKIWVGTDGEWRTYRQRKREEQAEERLRELIERRKERRKNRN